MARLIDYFPDWISGGLFAGEVLDWCPWVDELSQDELRGLDMEYFGNHSGYKMAAPLIDKIAMRPQDRQIGHAGTVRMEWLRNILFSMYHYEWTKLWNAWKEIYDPLNNYNMTDGTVEHVNDNGSRDTEVNSNTSTDTTYTNSVKPLNSSAFEDLTKSTGDMDTTRLKASNTEGVDIQNDRWRTVDKTRKGNVGTLSYQDMLQKEMDLRKNHFFDIIMADLDRVLTIPYWE